MTTIQAPEQAQRAEPRGSLRGLIVYLLLGIGFGIVLTKAEVISWFRIQEMFRFHSIHMYGILATAITVAATGVALIKRFELRAIDGSAITFEPKVLGSGTRYWLGGGLFGIGWAFTGACPGPLLATIGSGVTVLLVTLLAAIAGTWVYGRLRPRLPH